MDKEAASAAAPRLKRPITARTLLTAALLALLLCQLSFLLWLNLTQLRFHMGYDASTEYYRAFEMYRQGRLMPANWRDTTVLQLDAPVALAALLLHAVPDLFTAYGLANSVYLLLFVITGWKALRRLGCSTLPALLALNLLLCPHLVELSNRNDLGYISCMLTSGGYYLGMFVTFFLLIWSWCRLAEERPLQGGDVVLCVLTAASLYICCVSRGFYPGLMLAVPAALCCLWEAMRKNSLRALFTRRLLFAGALLLCMLAGKYTSSRILGFVSREEILELTLLSALWDNVRAVLSGYLRLLNALPYPDSVEALSWKSLTYLSGLAIAAAAFPAGLCRTVRALRGREEVSPLPAALFFWNLLLLCPITVTYGSAIFEERYLIVVFLSSVLCLAMYAEERAERLGMLLLTAALLLCAAWRDVQGDRAYAETRIDTARLDAVAETVGALPSPVVYYDCAELTDDIFTLRNMRCWDTGHVYRDIWREGSVVNAHWRQEEDTEGLSPYDYYFVWGDSDRYSLRSEWTGPITLVIQDECFAALPAALREEFTLVRVLWDGLAVYTAESNVLGLEKSAKEQPRGAESPREAVFAGQINPGSSCRNTPG